MKITAIDDVQFMVIFLGLAAITVAISLLRGVLKEIAAEIRALRSDLRNSRGPEETGSVPATE